jgi:hypothetical protein
VRKCSHRLGFLVIIVMLLLPAKQWPCSY